MTSGTVGYGELVVECARRTVLATHRASGTPPALGSLKGSRSQRWKSRPSVLVWIWGSPTKIKAIHSCVTGLAWSLGRVQKLIGIMPYDGRELPLTHR